MRLRRDVVLPAVTAVIAGALAFVLIGRMTATRDVVVASRDLEPMASVTESSVRVVSMPHQSVHAKAFTRVKDTLGKRVLGPISEGQQITVDNLSDPGQGLRKWTTPGRVVMFVPMPLNRWLGGQVAPGDSIDLIFCANQQKTGVNVSRTVLAGITVASVKGTGQDRWDQGGSEPTGLSLVVSAQDAEMIAFCLENGSLFACLSTPHALKAGEGATIETVLGKPITQDLIVR